MRIFVTGATGFIGTALVPELTQAGHKVLGMTRTEQGAEALAKAGADVHRGTIEDLDSLKAGAAQVDAVIHLAFNHDFSRFQANCEDDRRAIEAIGDELAGSGRPFIGTAGVLAPRPNPGEPFDEDEMKPADGSPRQSEEATLETLDKGVRGIVMRLSQIHDTHKQGLVSFLIRVALEKKVVAYVGDGHNRWAAAHVSDTAQLYRLAIEKGESGSRWHAVAEQGVASKEIAEALGSRLGLPVVSISQEEAPAYFGFLGRFMALDSPTSNTKTRERLGWEPTGPGLIEDLNHLMLSEGGRV
jgi:nucleoside-diphosphate-sugar epimerase